MKGIRDSSNDIVITSFDSKYIFNILYLSCNSNTLLHVTILEVYMRISLIFHQEKRLVGHTKFSLIFCDSNEKGIFRYLIK